VPATDWTAVPPPSPIYANIFSSRVFSKIAFQQRVYLSLRFNAKQAIMWLALSLWLHKQCFAANGLLQTAGGVPDTFKHNFI